MIFFNIPAKMFVQQIKQRDEDIKHAIDTMSVLSETFKETRSTDLLIEHFCIEMDLNILQIPYN